MDPTQTPPGGMQMSPEVMQMILSLQGNQSTGLTPNVPVGSPLGQPGGLANAAQQGSLGAQNDAYNAMMTPPPMVPPPTSPY